MPFSNYSELISEIPNLSARTDTDVTSRADDFLDIAEAEIYPKLRVRDMEERTRATLTAGTRRLPLPDDYLAIRSLELVLSGPNKPLAMHSESAITEQNGSGEPSFYSIADELEFDRIAGTDYTIQVNYYKKMTALSGSNTTNWLLLNSPQTLLDGAAWAMYKFLQDYDSAAIHFADMNRQIENLNDEARKGRYAPNARARFRAV